MTRIRVATAADAERIETVHEAAVRTLGPAAYDDVQVETWAAGEDADEENAGGIPEDDDHWIVAERDGEVAGWGRIDADAGEITGSYVHPEHARSGVGSALIAALEGYARGRALDALSLDASKNAVDFYERLGYERAGAVEHGTDEVPIDCLTMRKPL